MSRTPVAVGLAVAMVLASPAWSAQAAWRGYVESFPSPTEIPLFAHLGVSVDVPVRLDGFVRVMDRAGLKPQSLAAEPSLETQAGLVTKSLDAYGDRLARTVGSLPVVSGRETLDPFLRQLQDLSSVADLLPMETRRLLERAHADVDMLIGYQERERSEEITARIERVKNLWNDRREADATAAPPPAVNAADVMILNEEWTELPWWDRDVNRTQAGNVSI